ncbi:MAG: 4-(cytidine 5'-diphospho)-2-C-methyl-D-erythritol kinase [Sneathiella sp.]
MSLSKLARPKVNLFLHVTGKRDDGYHLLESLVCFPCGGDRIEVSAADQITASVSGPFGASIGTTDENLVVKAAKLLKTQFNITAGAHIHLEKNLPVASGIGGGSSNAAVCLQLLCELWNVTPSPEILSDIALQLGADVPVCLAAVPALMTGIGEQVTPVAALPNLHILLVNPLVAVSTPEVFKAINWSSLPAYDDYEDVGSSADGFIAKLAQTSNHLQAPAISLLPEIATVLKMIEAQPDCLLSRMSGSGATCFGLFNSAGEAAFAQKKILEIKPDWWSLSSAINSEAQSQ